MRVVLLPLRLLNVLKGLLLVPLRDRCIAVRGSRRDRCFVMHALDCLSLLFLPLHPLVGPREEKRFSSISWSIFPPIPFHLPTPYTVLKRMQAGFGGSCPPLSSQRPSLAVFPSVNGSPLVFHVACCNVCVLL